MKVKNAINGSRDGWMSFADYYADEFDDDYDDGYEDAYDYWGDAHD